MTTEPLRSIPGLHHVTAISGPPQPNVDFFTKTLDQKLIKKTVNFDAPDTYHLYYGNEAGDPGTILTFFPFPNAGLGQAGPGMAAAYAYAVPRGRFEGWIARLADHGIETRGPRERFGERVILLRDPDGAPVELVETDRASDASLDGFHSVTLWEDDITATARLLTDVFGYVEQGHEAARGVERVRFAAPGDARGTVIDILRSDAAAAARPGAGTIHHIAFRAEDDAVQQTWRDRLLSAGHAVTDVTDRQYFNAIYFREPGGVLFEIATDPPGFAVDEDPAKLGQSLKLPPRYEAHRERIEQLLPALTT